MGRHPVFIAALLASVCLNACGDNQEQRTPTEPRFSTAAKPGSGCDFQAVQQGVNAEFTGQSDVDVSKLVTSMKNYGTGGDVSNATFVGYQILDSVTHSGRKQGTPAAGSTLVISLLKCMEVGGAAIPTSFTGPLGDTTGAIGVRGRSASDAQGLLSHDGEWTLETPGGVSWRSIISTGANVADSVKHTVLAYGNGATSTGFTHDALLSTVYDWATVPVATFSPGVTVGQCSGDLAYIQHNSASGTNAEILAFVPVLCTGSTALLQEREPRTFADRVGRLLSPEPAYATALLAGGSGGTRGSLSPFGKTNPGAVNLSLEVQPNKSGNQVGKPLVDLNGNPLAVAASSNGGTPFKQTSVFAWIEATSNNGVNVAACNNWAYSDANGRITFPTVYLNKAGGYTITIKTVGTDVSSSAASTPPLPPGKQPTSALFNVKNGTLASQCVTHDGTPPLPAPLQ